MKTFKAFLLEDSENSKEINPEDIDKLLAKNCSEFLHENKDLLDNKKFLYRGSDDIKYNNCEVTPRSDRLPLSTPIKIHEFLDNYFEKRFGFKYRSGGLFTTLSHSTARSYDNRVFCIFPVNGYKLCSSNVITDLYEFQDDPLDVFELYLNDELNIHDEDNRSKHWKRFEEFNNMLSALAQGKSNDTELLFNVLDYAEYDEYKKIEKVETKTEIMIQCSKYYAINYIYAQENHIDKIIKDLTK